MIITTTHGGIVYELSNDSLKVGDKVFPIAKGRCIGDEFVIEGFIFAEWYSDFPNDPHVIIDLEYSDCKPYQIRTNHGYGPIEKYFKIIHK